MPLQRDCASEESRLSSVSGECYYPAQLQYYYLESSANRAVPLLKIKEITKISLLKFHPESSSNGGYRTVGRVCSFCIFHFRVVCRTDSAFCHRTEI